MLRCHLLFKYHLGCATRHFCSLSLTSLRFCGVLFSFPDLFFFQLCCTNFCFLHGERFKLNTSRFKRSVLFSKLSLSRSFRSLTFRLTSILFRLAKCFESFKLVSFTIFFFLPLQLFTSLSLSFFLFFGFILAFFFSLSLELRRVEVIHQSLLVSFSLDASSPQQLSSKRAINYSSQELFMIDDCILHNLHAELNSFSGQNFQF
mmetsp:Transcript_3051/g.6573  ORF Transcript_3051/g.6573 Transcript_3051/m.6573 type:complete len:204 (-) Transcript_3051:2010-2621(-)